MSDIVFDFKNLKVIPLPDSIIYQKEMIDASFRDHIRKQFLENARQFNITICKERDRLLLVHFLDK